jgi:predicted lipid-binding transport protein (Tim44 family)
MIGLLMIGFFSLPWGFMPDESAMEPQDRSALIMGMWVMMILIILFIGWLAGRRMIVRIRKEKVRKFIREFSLKDPFWNEEEMLKVSRTLFNYVQMAWIKRNFYYVTNYITDQLKAEWETRWQKMTNTNIGYHSSKLDIDRVIIVGVEDYSNNEKDSFSVEISGYIKRYMYNKSTMSVISKNTSELEYITDIYTFVRRNDRWQLNKIHYNAGILDILSMQVFFEKPGKPDHA